MEKTCAAAGACNCCCGEIVFEAGQYLENDGAARAKRWAQSRDSPDGIADGDSPTGLTMSAKEWALEAKKNGTAAVQAATNEMIDAAIENYGKDAEENQED